MKTGNELIREAVRHEKSELESGHKAKSVLLCEIKRKTRN